MDAEALKALFEPFGVVAVKRMFGGAGSMPKACASRSHSGGEVFLKADALSEADFSAAGSSPFVYEAKGKPMPMSFWRLPAMPMTTPTRFAAGRRWARGGAARGRRQGQAEGGRQSGRRAEAKAE